MVSNTVDDCLQRQIAQNNFEPKIEARPGNAGHYMAFKHSISFATDLTANFGCYRFRITIFNHACRGFQAFVCHHLKSLRCSIRSEQTPFPRIGRRFRPAVLHRSEHAVLFLCHIFTQNQTNDSSKDLAKRCALPWSATTSGQFHRKFHFT